MGRIILLMLLVVLCSSQAGRAASYIAWEDNYQLWLPLIAAPIRPSTTPTIPQDSLPFDAPELNPTGVENVKMQPAPVPDTQAEAIIGWVAGAPTELRPVKDSAIYVTWEDGQSQLLQLQPSEAVHIAQITWPQRVIARKSGPEVTLITPAWIRGSPAWQSLQQAVQRAMIATPNGNYSIVIDVR